MPEHIAKRCNESKRKLEESPPRTSRWLKLSGWLWTSTSVIGVVIITYVSLYYLK